MLPGDVRFASNLRQVVSFLVIEEGDSLAEHAFKYEKGSRLSFQKRRRLLRIHAVYGRLSRRGVELKSVLASGGLLIHLSDLDYVAICRGFHWMSWYDKRTSPIFKSLRSMGLLSDEIRAVVRVIRMAFNGSYGYLQFTGLRRHSKRYCISMTAVFALAGLLRLNPVQILKGPEIHARWADSKTREMVPISIGCMLRERVLSV